MNTQTTPLTIIVLESGSSWPTWFDQSGQRVVVVRQGEDDSLAELRQRTLAELDALPSDESVALCIIACAERVDRSAQSNRRCLGAAVVRRLDCSLTFHASDRTQGRFRHILSALAADVEQECGKENICVRFSRHDSIVPPLAPPSRVA